MVLLLFVVVAVTSLLFAATPRLFNRVSDEALRYIVNAAPAAQRNVTLALNSRISPGVGGGVSGVRADGDQLVERFPPRLAALISGQSLVVTTTRFYVTDPPSFETHVSLRYQDGFTDATRLVAGRWPISRDEPLQQARIGSGSGGTGGGGTDGGGTDAGQSPGPTIVETAISSSAAAAIGAHLGDRLPITVDGSDPLLARSPLQIAPAEIEIVGLYEPLDATADYWAGDTSLLEAKQGGSDLRPVAYVTGYVPAEMYPDLAASGLPFRYEWRLTIDPERLDASDVAALQDELRHLGFTTSAVALVAPGTVTVRTSLPAILDRYVAQLARSQSLLAVAAIGPFGLAAGAMAMIAILLVTSRRAELTLTRGRGASGWLVLGTELWEAILIAGGASLLGLLAATLLVPARDSPLAPVLAITTGAAAVLLLLGASWPMARRPLGQLGREDPPVLRVSARRLVIELTIVGTAIAGALLLRQRGLTFEGETGAPRFDPLLAAVPLLVGLAAGIVVMRLYPLPIRGLGWLAARRRDLIPVLGLRTIGRRRAAANLPLLVLLLTATFGAFASVITSTVGQGQLVTSYQAVGADYRVERIGIGALPPSLDPASIPGVEAVANGMVDETAAFATTQSQLASINLEAIDPRAYQQVTSGTPADPGWPAAILAPPPSGTAGTEADPIPAILSNQLPSGSAPLAAGDTFRITVAGQPMTFRVVQRRARFPGVSAAVPFAIVPFDWIRAATSRDTLPPSVMWVRGPDSVSEPLAAAVAAAPGTARIVSRYDAYAALHDAPLSSAIASVFVLALFVGALYMAITIVGALVLSATRRTQDLAYLRTLGVTARQALALTVVDHAPPVAIAVPVGVLLGVGIADLLGPAMGLGTFVGSVEVPLTVDAPALALMVAGVLLVIVAAVAIGTWLSRRARLVDALRIGDD